MSIEPERPDRPAVWRSTPRRIGAALRDALPTRPDDEPAGEPPASVEPEPAGQAQRHPVRVTPAAGGLRLVGSGDDDRPVWQAHADYDESNCPGALRFVDRAGPVWMVECDHEPCRMAFGIPRVRVDRDYQRAGRRSRACLPERFVDRALEPNPGNEEALMVISAVVSRWGERECPRPPLLVGRSGRGKTHLITAALRLLIERHEADVWYVTVSDLLDEAKRSMETETPVRPVFDRAAAVPLLALDDLGADALGKWGRNELQALIDRRHRRSLPIIGATNLPVDQWDSHFGERVASRLHDLSKPVLVTGEDWRRK